MQKLIKLDAAPKFDLSHYKDDNGEWLEGAQWPHHDVVVICRTPGCEAENVVHDVSMPINPDGEIRVTCHNCKKQPVTYAA
jgi:hypothetical protein